MRSYSSIVFIPLLAILLLWINPSFSQDYPDYGGSGSCDDNMVSTLDGECQLVCASGYIWCPEGYVCKPITQTTYQCECDVGYRFDQASGNCLLAKFFGGLIYFDGVDATTTTDRKRRSPRDGGCNITEAEELIATIYSTSIYYYISSDITDVTDDTPPDCTYAYQVEFKDDKDVNMTYFENLFDDATNNCALPADFPPTFNCTLSQKGVGDSTGLCGKNGVYGEKCNDSTVNCKVTDNGYGICSCISDQYVLPYSDATFCSIVKCNSDGDCSGGGIHGSCVKQDNPAENYCQCKWGFTGEKCEDPWWFVFTVLTGAFGAIAIAILIACICMSGRTKTVKTDAVPKDELDDLKNPFVDFQPGVRARVSPNLYNTVTDSLSGQTTQGHSNPAFNNNPRDDYDKLGSGATGNDYF